MDNGREPLSKDEARRELEEDLTFAAMRRIVEEEMTLKSDTESELARSFNLVKNKEKKRHKKTHQINNE